MACFFVTSLDSIYRNDLSGLQIAAELYRFVEEEALPGSGVDSDAFWSGAARLFEKYKPMTRALLVRRDELQSEIDNYYLSESKEPYEAFLRRIGYVVDQPDDFEITTGGVDPRLPASQGRSSSSRS